MPRKHGDRRPQKTRQALSTALISLMIEKRYDSIVVQEILDRANIGRSTFYLHYRDKDELLVDGLQGLKELLRDTQKKTPLVAGKRHERVIGFSLAMFEHAHGHRKLYRSLVGGPGWIIVRQHIEDTLAQLMKEEAKAHFKMKGSSDVPFDLFIHFLASTFLLVLTWWNTHKSSVLPEEINDLYRGLVLPTLAANMV